MDTQILKLYALFLFFAVSHCLFAQSSNPEKGENEDHEGPRSIIKYFETWHQPYGKNVPVEKQKKIWQEINRLPSEPKNRSDNPVNAWQPLGPYGMQINNAPPNFQNSGRILDIETDNAVTGLLVASASGGLWGYAFYLIPYCLSDNINSLVIGSFDSKKSDGNTIIVGTGEPGVKYGDGIYKTTDKGTTWAKKTIVGGDPYGFYKLRYHNRSNNYPNTIFAASSSGVYRSDDNGETWNLKFPGDCTDICFTGVINTVLYTSKMNDGMFYSNDNGDTWTRLTTPGLPLLHVGRTAISSVFDDYSYESIIYVSMTDYTDNKTMGVYKSTNSGSSWINITPPGGDFHWGQGWYNNAIAVNPSDPNTVLVCGCLLRKTTDGGTTWQLSFGSPDYLHVDMHTIAWKNGTSLAYLGHDGGISSSLDAGSSWNTLINFLPVTQYVNFDVGPSTDFIYGGSQDNGISGSTDGGISWIQYQGGDGGGVCIAPGNSNNIFMTDGDYYSGGILFRRFSTTNGGASWVDINNGILPSQQWYTQIRNDNVPPINLFSNNGPNVYKSNNLGNDWSKLNQTDFPCWVFNLDVSIATLPNAIVYASLAPGALPFSGTQLRIYDSGNWYERSGGFPDSVWVRSVMPHHYNTNIAYACMNGFSHGKKVFMTTDKGINWTNITGDLPDIPISYIVPHPTLNNILFLGSEYGCYKTTNGGANWMRWNNGMPQANIITEMKYVFDGSNSYIYASSYGRGIWRRNINGDDPGGITISRSKNSLRKVIGGFQNTSDTIHVQVIQNSPQITNMVFRMDSLLDSRDMDLQAFLIGPNGTVDTLFSNAGGNGQNFLGTLLRDTGPLGIQNGTAPFTGIFRPYQSLSAFNQSSPNGDWILKIYDNQASNTGMLNAWSMDITYTYDTPVGQNNNSIASNFKVYQNYPNPFNPSTKIIYEIPRDNKVKLIIYDILGREVKILLNEFKKTGHYEAIFDGSNFASGVYFYKIFSGDFEDTKKMVMIK